MSGTLRVPRPCCLLLAPASVGPGRPAPAPAACGPEPAHGRRTVRQAPQWEPRAPAPRTAPADANELAASSKWRLAQQSVPRGGLAVIPETAGTAASPRLCDAGQLLQPRLGGRAQPSAPSRRRLFCLWSPPAALIHGLQAESHAPGRPGLPFCTGPRHLGHRGHRSGSPGKGAMAGGGDTEAAQQPDCLGPNATCVPHANAWPQASLRLSLPSVKTGTVSASSPASSPCGPGRIQRVARSGFATGLGAPGGLAQRAASVQAQPTHARLGRNRLRSSVTQRKVSREPPSPGDMTSTSVTCGVPPTPGLCLNPGRGRRERLLMVLSPAVAPAWAAPLLAGSLLAEPRGG